MRDDDLPPHLRDRTSDRVQQPVVPLAPGDDRDQPPDSDPPPKREPYGTPYLRRD